MEFTKANHKDLWLIVEITRLLRKYDCTYEEADEIIKQVALEIKIQRECYEYDDVDDLIAGVKKRDGKDAVISALNHVPPYC